LQINRRPGRLPYATLVAAISIAVAVIATEVRASCADYPRSVAPRSSEHQSRTSGSSVPRSVADSRLAPRFVQDSDEDADSEVPPDQVEKYVAVYKDMQRNRSLTVETAAAKEGLTVAEFRELERKVGRDETAREHVRTELQAGAAETP